MDDLAPIEPILQNTVESSPKERHPAGLPARLAETDLAHHPARIERPLKTMDTFEVQIEAIDQSDLLSLVGMDLECSIAKRIAERDGSPHPHPLLLGRGHLVADPFPR